MKFKDIIKTSNSNLVRSKLRTFLTLMAIMIGSLTISLTIGLGSGISSYVDSQLSTIGSDDMLLVRPKPPANDQFGENGPQRYNPDIITSTGLAEFSIPVLTTKDVEIISNQEKIVSVEPAISATPEYIFTTESAKFKTTMSELWDGAGDTLIAGEVVNDSSQFQAVIPIDFIEALGFNSSEDAIGNTATIGVKTGLGDIQEIDFLITGIQERSILGSGLGVNRSFLLATHDLQVQGLPEESKNQFFALTAFFESGLEDKEVKIIKDNLSNLGYQAMTIEDTIGIIHNVINAITYVLVFFAAIVLLAASFGIVNTLFMAVQERTKEIGLMKAMGMSSQKVFLLFSTEAALIGFWGSLIGVIIANGVGALVNKVASNTFLQDLEGFDLMSFPVTTMLAITFVIMLIAFLAGTLPARRAAKLNPIDALRYE